MRSHLGQLVLFCLVMALLLSPVHAIDLAEPASPDAVYTVSGRVTGPGGPLQGVPVYFDCCATEWFVLTNANGDYSFTVNGAQDASVIVSPSLESRLGQATRFLQVRGNMGNVNFVLAPGHLLAGRVVNQNGLPANLDHDLLNATLAKQILEFTEYAEFSLYLPPGEYDLAIGLPGEDWENHHVDLRSGDVPFWEVVVNAPDEDLPLAPQITPDEPPPLVERITVGAPNANGIVHITGAAGAIASGIPRVDIVNLNSGAVASVPVQGDGSFVADIRAPYGSALQFRTNPYATEYDRISGTGTILWVYPDSMADQGDVPVYLAGRAGDYRGWWAVTGTVNDHQFEPGDLFEAELDITIAGPQVDARFDDGSYRLLAVLHFERFFDDEGRHQAASQRGTSTSLTPTGLPVEGMAVTHPVSDYTPLTIKASGAILAAHRTGSKLNLSRTLSGNLPATLPAGLYRPALVLMLGPSGDLKPLPSNPYLCPGDSLDDRAELTFDENGHGNHLPVIRVGEPAVPRLPWALLVNTFGNGARGTIARNEVELLGLSTRTTFQPERFVIPPKTVYQQPIEYRLEPFLPTLSSSLASDVEPYPPLLPLAFPGGELQVRITRPDGTVDSLGTAPFQQSRNGLARQRFDHYIGADRTLQKVYEVTTLDDKYTVQFEDYGLHQVRVRGSVEDVWGNGYDGGGTYDIWLAETLDLEPAVFPGQPFEVGDALAAGVVIQPAVPADVTVEFTLVPADGVPIVHQISGKANRYGYFQPAGASYTLPEAGEYRLDITAEYWDDEGVLWVGTSRGAGVVETPASQLVAHGERGMSVHTTIRPQWFLVSSIHPSGLKESVPSTPEDDSFMTLYPYQTGDILWTSDQSNSIVAEVTVQDQDGWYETLLQGRRAQVRYNERLNRTLAERATLGELPLIPTTSSAHIWSLFPEDVDAWSYAYISTQRPGVSVRGYVGTDDLYRIYWSTDYKYDRQLGNGVDGDWHNDIKLQYGGAVIRNASHQEYLGYASMEVLIPFGADALGIRTFPPFQGHSGGPDGGPILTLKGEEVDLFLTPTGLRPGSVLEVGDTVAVAGTMWPTLDSKGTFTFIAPSGATHTVQSQANRFGYYFASGGQFVVDEAGIWTVEARLVHDAVVPSTGLAPTGKNTGDLLGARTCDGQGSPVGCGQFYFYVTEPGAQALALTSQPRLGRLTGAIPLVLEGEVPTDWTAVEGTATAVMSGYILEERDLDVSGGQFRYSFDPWTLHNDFPNLDVQIGPNTPGLVDTFTISLMLSGIDGTGERVYRAKSVVLQGQELQALPHGAGGEYEVYLPVVLR